MWGSTVRVVLGVVRPIVVPDFLVTSSVERFVKGTFSRERQIASSKHLAKWRVQLLKFDGKLARRAEIKHKTSDAISMLKTDRAEKVKLDKELVALMIDATKAQGKVKTERLDKNQPCKEQSRESTDKSSNELQPSTVRKLLDVQAYDHT